MKKPRRKFTDEAKRQAVDDYVSGRKSVLEIGSEIGCNANLIYRWKAEFESEKRSDRVTELAAEGHNPNDIRKILELEDELEEYKKKLAEQILINDLLKKLRDSKSSPRESELTGLIRTSKNSDRKRKPAK